MPGRKETVELEIVGKVSSGDISGLEQIRQALERAEQAGRKYEEIDFSKPELAELKAAIDAAHNSFQVLQNSSTSLQDSLKKTGQVGKEVWQIEPGMVPEGVERTMDQAIEAGMQIEPGMVPEGAVMPVPAPIKPIPRPTILPKEEQAAFVRELERELEAGRTIIPPMPEGIGMGEMEQYRRLSRRVSALGERAEMEGGVLPEEQIKRYQQLMGMAEPVKFRVEADISQLKEALEQMKATQEQFEELKKGFEIVKLPADKYAKFLEESEKLNESIKQTEKRLAKMNQIAAESGERIGRAQEVMADVEPQEGGGGMGAWSPFSLRGAMRWGGVGLGLAGIGGIASILQSGVSGAQQLAIGTTDLQRRLGFLGDSFEDFRKQLSDSTIGLGMTNEETVTLAHSMAQMRNVFDPDRLRQEIRNVVGFARGFGLDPMTIGQLTSQASRLGIIGREEGQVGAQMTTKEFMGNLAVAVREGQMGGRVEEVIQAIVGLSAVIEQRSLFAPNIETMLPVMTAMNQTMIEGLRGARGAQLLGGLTQGFSAPGGGEAGEALMYQALGGARIGYPAYKLLRDLGPFGTEKELAEKLGELKIPVPAGVNIKGEETNIDRVMEMLRTYFANPLLRTQGMEEILKVPGWQGLGLEKALGEVKGSEIKKRLEELKINFKELAPERQAPIATILGETRPEKLKEIAKEYLGKMPGVTPEEKKRVEGLMGEKSTVKALQDELVKLVEAKGIITTEGDKTRVSIADMKKAFDEFGNKLLPTVNAIREGVTTAARIASDIYDSLPWRVAQAGRHIEGIKDWGPKELHQFLQTGAWPKAPLAKLDKEKIPANIRGTIEGQAKAQGIDPEMMLRLAQSESSFKPESIGDIGQTEQSYGLFGLKLSTAKEQAKRMGIDPKIVTPENLQKDIDLNVKLGIGQYAYLAKKYPSAIDPIIAYKGGEKALEETKKREKPIPQTTRDFIKDALGLDIGHFYPRPKGGFYLPGVESKAIGDWNISQDKIVRAHRGEMIIPEPAAKWLREEIPKPPFENLSLTPEQIRESANRENITINFGKVAGMAQVELRYPSGERQYVKLPLELSDPFVGIDTKPRRYKRW